MCGKKGYYSNNYRTQQKINELLIDDSLKRKLSQILLTNESSDDKDYLYESYSNLFEKQIEEGESCEDIIAKVIIIKPLLK